MLLNRFVIPAIDIIDGKCVRLSQGDYAQKKIYNEHPLEVAKMFEAAGINRLHLVDLDGAKAGRIINLKVLETLASGTNLQIDFGGGIKTAEDVKGVLNAGATMATIGSLAVKKPAVLIEIISLFGPDKLFIGADVKQEKIAVSGWLEQTDIQVVDFINDLTEKGLSQFFCTDIEKDGMMQGPSTELYKMILKNCNGIALTASGGVTKLSDLFELQQAGCSYSIVGKALYEGTISLSDLQNN